MPQRDSDRVRFMLGADPCPQHFDLGAHGFVTDAPQPRYVTRANTNRQVTQRFNLNGRQTAHLLMRRRVVVQVAGETSHRATP